MNKMPLVYREKPYLVYSIQYTNEKDIDVLKSWVETHGGSLYNHDEQTLVIIQDGYIDYIEKGDYLVREMNGNMYSCSEKTFNYRFEKVE